MALPNSRVLTSQLNFWSFRDFANQSFSSPRRNNENQLLFKSLIPPKFPVMISKNFAFVASLFVGVTLANIFPPAELVPIQQLQKRNPYYGGYALRQGATVCSKSTQTCATGFCCPANTWCSENINGPYCCPTC